MPYIVRRQYITDEQYISHELAKLAECAFIMPWSITAHTADKIIGNRYDRLQWIEKFKAEIERIAAAKTGE